MLMYTRSYTDSQPNPSTSTLKSQAAVGVPTNQEQPAEGSPVENPEVILSMCNVKLSNYSHPQAG